MFERFTIKSILKNLKEFINRCINSNKITKPSHEGKPEKTDWSARNVMVGSVRDMAQFEYNLKNNCYYVPARFVLAKNMPVTYIALHEDDIADSPCIKRIGAVTEIHKIKRKHIPVPTHRKNGEELYYYFKIKEWEIMKNSIIIKDTYKGRPLYTNKFLLDNCKYSYQLFSINSMEQYLLMCQIDKALNLPLSVKEGNEFIYRINNMYSVASTGKYFIILDVHGNMAEKIEKSEFVKRPRIMFNKIKKITGV